MASETNVARESRANPLNALQSEEARRSGHTASDYIDMYRQQKAGTMEAFVEGRISEAEYNSRMERLNKKIAALS